MNLWSQSQVYNFFAPRLEQALTAAKLNALVSLVMAKYSVAQGAPALDADTEKQIEADVTAIIFSTLGMMSALSNKAAITAAIDDLKRQGVKLVPKGTTSTTVAPPPPPEKSSVSSFFDSFMNVLVPGAVIGASTLIKDKQPKPQPKTSYWVPIGIAAVSLVGFAAYWYWWRGRSGTESKRERK